MSGGRADSPIRWAVGSSGGVVVENSTRAFSIHPSNFLEYLRSQDSLMVGKVPVPYQNGSKIKRVHDTYPGLSGNKSTIGIQPLPRHRELQMGLCLRNKLVCMRTESSSRGGGTVLGESCDIVSYPSRCSSLGMFRCRTASKFYCGFIDPSNHEDVQEQRLAEFSSNRSSFSSWLIVLKTNAQTALSTQAVLFLQQGLMGVPSPDSVAYHAGKCLKTLDPATTALLAGRYSRLVGCWAAPLGSGRLAGFNVRFAMLTEQLLVTVGTVNWLQIEAIPLLCSDGLALLNVWSSSPCLHRSPHRCHAETVLAPSSLCV
ncbi:hypothetical protein GE21DRAFT_2812 [Neurospora crassa]|uniref:Uncharacterized protein n=2 Tax=Neurospora crassa TaxID=5141 RepID=F5H9X4_NEUCR|nr:hypothetical protein NCU03449 [Neurospora crassa OR74A]EAA27499.2 hypothetical protein NCU03449 [Neurospora crassa OR74A]KHE86357.1 hypothetical protein GE21DRAFT_2812 [Neurospora crassa]CAB98226.2 hypothetical protein [Neurospora crassa]|eukprot:XP_956735.2 hypothetical protein NCU03449 [Neurospora crassa OR74A]